MAASGIRQLPLGWRGSSVWPFCCHKACIAQMVAGVSPKEYRVAPWEQETDEGGVIKAYRAPPAVLYRGLLEHKASHCR